ncbi:Adenylate kinase isoenzyme 1 [Hypsibius exemplaris]|uniref:Adenylate kinase isoenzyme 1 n=1 Tax=Hypsibius exemplaris TaxID=2072580 RepID=A0A1W0WSY1_HYPEX|nr:Adenylate kinase isoenzyme 1 [Hypsibius exemplaris]
MCNFSVRHRSCIARCISIFAPIFNDLPFGVPQGLSRRLNGKRPPIHNLFPVADFAIPAAVLPPAVVADVNEDLRNLDKPTVRSRYPAITWTGSVCIRLALPLLLISLTSLTSVRTTEFRGETGAIRIMAAAQPLHNEQPLSAHIDTDHNRNGQAGRHPIVFVMGGPGSGKGTQCALIKERFGFCHLSTGDLLRDEVSSGSPRGEWLNSIMVKGDLVPLEVVLNLLKEAIHRESQRGARGFLIDGFPREVSQALEFEKQVGCCAQVIYFEVPFDVMSERLIRRGITSGRADDNAETIRKRLQTFADQTIPVVSHYQKAQKTTIIPANREVDAIFADVTTTMKSLLASIVKDTEIKEPVPLNV